MKLILRKHKLSELLRAGVDVDQYVLIPESDDISEIDKGAISANLTFTDKAIRTTRQNSAIHKYCSMLASAFNDAGLDMLAVLKVKQVSVPWSMEKVKDVLWREIQEAMFGTRSTTKLDTAQVSKVYEVMNRHTAENLGVSLDFPNRFHGIKYED